jgi:hypothetical protein
MITQSTTTQNHNQLTESDKQDEKIQPLITHFLITDKPPSDQSKMSKPTGCSEHYLLELQFAGVGSFWFNIHLRPIEFNYLLLRGLILSPTDSPEIDCYPDADFAGLYGHEDSQDPHCARSRTGYIIFAFGCPVLWKSRLQTEIALSKMEAEYVALSTACKDLFPIVDMIRELAGSVGIPVDAVANMHIRIHEDNVGALTLAKLEPARMTPRSKHYAIKYHWFCEHVHANHVKVVKIESANQLGDLFTKGLPRPAFEHLRSLLMGW